jgi:hypothetical protein
MDARVKPAHDAEYICQMLATGEYFRPAKIREAMS